MHSGIIDWLDKARIDIKNQGNNNDISVKVMEGVNSSITMPKWFSEGGAGYVLETHDQHLKLELSCHGKGTLLLSLKGIDKRIAEEPRLPLWVDYTRLAVNEEVIFWELKPQWHNRPYKFARQVEDGERIIVEISWSHHGYKGRELSELISMLHVNMDG